MGYSEVPVSHFITKCSCGTVLAQCRCPDNNKPVNVVKNGCDKCKAEAAKKASQ
jgi:hypothetical protein